MNDMQSSLRGIDGADFSLSTDWLVIATVCSASSTSECTPPVSLFYPVLTCAHAALSGSG